MKFYIKGMRNKAIVATEGKKICEVSCKDMSDNECEWYALAEVMRHISGSYVFDDNITICMDSKLVYKQIPQIFRLNKPNEKWRIGKLRKTIGYVDWNRLKNKMITTRIDDKFEIKYEYVDSKKNKARDYVDE